MVTSRQGLRPQWGLREHDTLAVHADYLGHDNQRADPLTCCTFSSSCVALVHDQSPMQLVESNHPGRSAYRVAMIQDKTRVTIVQPAVPAYRVPVFCRLAETPRIDLSVYSARVKGVPEGSPEGFDYHPFSELGLGSSLAWWQKEWELAGSKDIDVLVLPWNTRVLSTVPALLRARLTGQRTVLWGHAMSRRRSVTTKVRNRLRNLIASLASAVMVYDYQTADSLGRQFGPDRVFVAPNALDQGPIQAARARLDSDPDRMRDFINENDLKGRDIILHVSRLIAARRLDVLLEAIPAVVRERPSALVVVIGDGPEKETLLQQVDWLAITDHVRFVPATYDEDALALWFGTAKVYCFPEGLGLSLFHALGYGTPVVLGDDLERHWPETKAITLGADAVGFRHGDSDDLGRVITSLLCDPKRRFAIAAAGRELVASRYNLDRMVEGIVAAILGTRGDHIC